MLPSGTNATIGATSALQLARDCLGRRTQDDLTFVERQIRTALLDPAGGRR